MCARFKADQAENYKPAGTGSFFGLENDKDCEQVRFMYNDMDDVELFSVHEVEVNGQKRWVNCLREYDEPIDNCPLCAAGNRLNVKMWVPLYIVKTGEVKIWERGRTFISKLQTANRRYNPLVSSIFDIERNGKKGDKETTYELFPVDRDNTKLEDLPELPQIVGTIVKELTVEQMETYLKTGALPLDEDNTTKTRNPVSDRRPVSNTEQPITRRPVRTRQTEESASNSDVF